LGPRLPPLAKPDEGRVDGPTPRDYDRVVLAFYEVEAPDCGIGTKPDWVGDVSSTPDGDLSPLYDCLPHGDGERCRISAVIQGRPRADDKQVLERLLTRSRVLLSQVTRCSRPPEKSVEVQRWNRNVPFG
jgi:hypothetical protein